MDRALAGLAWNICLYYLDDIIVFSASWEEHSERLKADLSDSEELILNWGQPNVIWPEEK